MVQIFTMAILFVLVLVGIFTLVVFWKLKRNGKYKTDYRSLFIMGITFLPLGIVFSVTISPGFFGIAALGMIYMLMGMAHKDEWETPKTAKKKSTRRKPKKK